MARTLLCEIVTPERIVYTNEVEMVIVPSVDGELGILPLHAPLVGVLQAGEVRIKYGDPTEWFAVSGGSTPVHAAKVKVRASRGGGGGGGRGRGRGTGAAGGNPRSPVGQRSSWGRTAWAGRAPRSRSGRG